MSNEYEEEVSYVTLDIGKSVTSDYMESILRSNGGCRIIGLEEGEPYLQLGELIFKGQIDETLGSHLFFEIEERKQETSGLLPLLSSIRSDSEEGPKIQRYSTTFKHSIENIIKMEPVNLTQKQQQPSSVTIPPLDNDEPILF